MTLLRPLESSEGAEDEAGGGILALPVATDADGQKVYKIFTVSTRNIYFHCEVYKLQLLIMLRYPRESYTLRNKIQILVP